MISEVDDNMSGSIDFGEFLKVVESQKARAENLDDENDMIDAFVACGGQADKTGHVKRDTMIKIIKHDFGLVRVFLLVLTCTKTILILNNLICYLVLCQYRLSISKI